MEEEEGEGLAGNHLPVGMSATAAQSLEASDTREGEKEQVKQKVQR